MRRSVTIALFAFFATAFSLSALPPGVSFGASGGTELYGTSTSAPTAYPFTAGTVHAYWRSNLPESGFFSLYGSAAFDYYPGNTSDYEDTENLSLSIGKPLGPGTVKAQIGVNSTLHGMGNSGVSARPDWSLGYGVDGGDQPFGFTVSYDGVYVYQETDSEDRLVNQGGLKLSYDPSIYYGGSLALRAAVEDWNEQTLYDSTGAETSENRRDYRLTGRLNASGLAGYFADWSTSLDVEARLSNANRYIAGTAELEENSEDRIGVTLDTGLSASPSSVFDLSTDLYLGNTWYLERSALDSNEEPLGETLTVFNAGGSLQGTYSISKTASITATVQGSRSIAADPDFDQWNLRLEAGISFRY